MIKPYNIIYSHLVLFTLLLAISLVSLSFIFSSPKIIEKELSGELLVRQYPAISIDGLNMLAESWLKYPEYNIGLGITAALGFIGSIMCVIFIEKLLKEIRKCGNTS